MIVVGIDPGLTGAIAALGHRGQILGLHDIPVMQRAGPKSTVRNQVNATGVAKLLRELLGDYDKNEVHVLIELVGAMPKQGVAAMLSIGHTCGILEGVVATLGYPHQLVRPQDWKASVKNATTKDQARARAQRLYPEAELSKVKHHNRAEALLIARYGWERFT